MIWSSLLSKKKNLFWYRLFIQIEFECDEEIHRQVTSCLFFVNNLFSQLSFFFFNSLPYVWQVKVTCFIYSWCFSMYVSLHFFITFYMCTLVFLLKTPSTPPPPPPPPPTTTATTTLPQNHHHNNYIPTITILPLPPPPPPPPRPTMPRPYRCPAQ